MTSVAIVEDQQIIRDSLCEWVNASPDCHCAGAFVSAEEALKGIPALAPDVVLMDIHLPGESGIVCTARLKKLLPGLHIIMVTVYNDPEKIFEALKAGACGYLLKRCGPEDVARALAEVRAGGAPMTAEIARQVVSAFHRQPAPQEEAHLSRREQEILALLAEGLSNKLIASRLGISPETVNVHLRKIYEKLHVPQPNRGHSKIPQKQGAAPSLNGGGWGDIPLKYPVSGNGRNGDFIQSPCFPVTDMKPTPTLLALAALLLPSVSRGALTSAYTFDETGGATAADSIRGGAGTGNLNGGSTFAAGKIGNAIEFDGSTGYVLAPNVVGTGTTSYSVSAWVWADAANTWGTIVKNWGGSSTGAFHLGFDNVSGRISNYVSVPTVGPVISPATLSLGAWHHIALTYDGGSASQVLYIDGLQVATGSASASLSALGTNMSIGVKTNNATTAPDPGAPGWWDGRIDDLAFFDNVLTPAEVLQIKNNGDAGIGVTVPEPASAGLLVLGMFGLVRRRR